MLVALSKSAVYSVAQNSKGTQHYLLEAVFQTLQPRKMGSAFLLLLLLLKMLWHTLVIRKNMVYFLHGIFLYVWPLYTKHSLRIIYHNLFTKQENHKNKLSEFWKFKYGWTYMCVCVCVYVCVCVCVCDKQREDQQRQISSAFIYFLYTSIFLQVLI